MAHSPRSEETTPHNMMQKNQPSWVEDILKWTKLSESEDIRKIFTAMDELASRCAPNTRKLWRWILILEGVAVVLPLSWLMVAQRGWPATGVSTLVAIFTLSMLGVCWWVRWKQQQQQWTKARLIAEIARSKIATAKYRDDITEHALESAPSLQALASLGETKDLNSGELSLEQIIRDYTKERIDDQSAFFAKKAKEASEERQKLSRLVTRSLDGALILAVLGLWLGYGVHTQWFFSIANTDLFLSVVGAILPLTAILMQSLSSYLELNRKAGRYSQQWEYLEQAKVRLNKASSKEEALKLIQRIEQNLLSEVVEWFYQTEHAEVFYRSTKNHYPADSRLKLTEVTESMGARTVGKLFSALGIILGFTGRLIFGRLLIVTITSVLTSLLLFSRAPEDAVQKSMIRLADGRILNSAGKTLNHLWMPTHDSAKNGLIVIAHGLHDSASSLSDGVDGSPHWMTAMQKALEKRLSKAKPEICLVDWSMAAKPSNVTASLMNDTDLATEFSEASSEEQSATKFAKDVAAIRAQAQAIGDMVGFKLCNSFDEKKPEFQPNQPIHLIGHSAGGFLVVRAALMMKRLNRIPHTMRVTLLDTPLPVEEELRSLVRDEHGQPDPRIQVDFYKSSILAQNVPTEFAAYPNYRYLDIESLSGANADTSSNSGSQNMFTSFKEKITHRSSSALKNHSFAHQWFIQTIEHESSSTAGFILSPFASR